MKRTLIESSGSLIAICVMLISIPAMAVEEKQLPVHITADKVNFDLNKEQSIYTGNVRIEQGNTRLQGSQVTIFQQDSEIIRMVATGAPAEYHHDNEDGTWVRAKSNHIQYLANKDRLIMTEQARLVQDEQIIESDRIVYNTKDQTLIAGGPAGKEDQNSRVKITLTPDND